MKRANVTFRVLAGGYLIYIGITLLLQFHDQQEYSAYVNRLIFFAIFFMLIGGLTVILPLVSFIRKKRKGELEQEGSNIETDVTAPMPEIIESRTGVITSESSKLPKETAKADSSDEKIATKQKEDEKRPFRRKGNIEVIK